MWLSHLWNECPYSCCKLLTCLFYYYFPQSYLHKCSLIDCNYHLAKLNSKVRSCTIAHTLICPSLLLPSLCKKCLLHLVKLHTWVLEMKEMRKGHVSEPRPPNLFNPSSPSFIKFNFFHFIPLKHQYK